MRSLQKIQTLTISQVIKVYGCGFPKLGANGDSLFLAALWAIVLGNGVFVPHDDTSTFSVVYSTTARESVAFVMLETQIAFRTNSAPPPKVVAALDVLPIILSMPPREVPHQTVSRNLKRLRLRAGLSVREASAQLKMRGIAVGERYLRQWENFEDPAEPILSDALDICNIYGCGLDELFGAIKDPPASG